MNVEWMVTGAILLSAIVGGGVNLYLRKRRKSCLDLPYNAESSPKEEHMSQEKHTRE